MGCRVGVGVGVTVAVNVAVGEAVLVGEDIWVGVSVGRGELATTVGETAAATGTPSPVRRATASSG